ncbi:hypothetical protein GCM10009131_02400 [Morganella psychrotolerans]
MVSGFTNNIVHYLYSIEFNGNVKSLLAAVSICAIGVRFYNWNNNESLSIRITNGCHAQGERAAKGTATGDVSGGVK